MFICGADKHNLSAARTFVTGVKIGGQLRPDKVAKMFDPVDIGNGGGNKDAVDVALS